MAEEVRRILYGTGPSRRRSFVPPTKNKPLEHEKNIYIKEQCDTKLLSSGSETPPPNQERKRETECSPLDMKTTKIADTHKCIPISNIGHPFCTLFQHLSHFNRVQSACFHDLYHSSNNVVISAPTGCGKTICLELAMVQLLHTKAPHTKPLMIYIAPMKALCDEREADWKQKFNVFGLEVLKVTGDSQFDDSCSVGKADIVITTPEKWDSMTRRWQDKPGMYKQIRLLLIDEVHVVGEPQRGHVLEVVATRMKTMSQQMSSHAGIRVVAVSATVPNIEDVAIWLRNHDDTPACAHFFGPEFRPVPLALHVEGYRGFDRPGDAFKFDHFLNSKVQDVINKFNPEHRPTLIFCLTRKSTFETAKKLKAFAMKSSRVRLFKAELREQSQGITDSSLRGTFLSTDTSVRNDVLTINETVDLITNGIGVHHAGLAPSDRSIVERLFLQGKLLVITATSTLAMGVNLPAHLVVIKGTSQYSSTGTSNLEAAQILQMIGRAGRPQFDQYGTAVVLTTANQKLTYEVSLNGAKSIESSLHRQLLEHINAEVSLETICSVEDAIAWLQSTFYYVRALKQPGYYGVKGKGTNLEDHMRGMCVDILNKLHSVGLIIFDEALTCKSTSAGMTVTKFYVAFNTFVLFDEMRSKENVEDMLLNLAKAQEFEDIHLRRQQKTKLRELNWKKKSEDRDIIRYPMKEGRGCIRTREMKVNCLIQAALGGLKIDDIQLVQDTQTIMNCATRVMRCFLETLYSVKSGVSFETAKAAITLTKCLQARLWWDSPHITKQLSRIGAAISHLFVSNGLDTLDKYLASQASTLETYAKRHPPFGDKLLDSLKEFPQFELSVNQTDDISSKRSRIDIHIKIKNSCEFRPQPGDSVHFLVSNPDGKLITWNKLSLQGNFRHGDFVSRMITIMRPTSSSTCHAHLIHSRLVGVDIQAKFEPTFLALADNRKETKRKLQVRKKHQERLTAKQTSMNIENLLEEDSCDSCDAWMANFDESTIMHELAQTQEKARESGDGKGNVESNENRSKIQEQAAKTAPTNKHIGVKSHRRKDQVSLQDKEYLNRSSDNQELAPRLTLTKRHEMSVSKMVTDMPFSEHISTMSEMNTYEVQRCSQFQQTDQRNKSSVSQLQQVKAPMTSASQDFSSKGLQHGLMSDVSIHDNQQPLFNIMGKGSHAYPPVVDPSSKLPAPMLKHASQQTLHILKRPHAMKVKRAKRAAMAHTTTPETVPAVVATDTNNNYVDMYLKQHQWKRETDLNKTQLQFQEPTPLLYKMNYLHKGDTTGTGRQRTNSIVQAAAFSDQSHKKRPEHIPVRYPSHEPYLKQVESRSHNNVGWHAMASETLRSSIIPNENDKLSTNESGRLNYNFNSPRTYEQSIANWLGLSQVENKTLLPHHKDYLSEDSIAKGEQKESAWASPTAFNLPDTSPLNEYDYFE